jgi:hypothetical protein
MTQDNPKANTELDDILADWEYEVTGTPKHWEKTDERKAIDRRYKAAINRLIEKEVRRARKDELRRLDRADDEKPFLNSDGLRYLMSRSAALEAESGEAISE